jgi:hypothetical protein
MACRPLIWLLHALLASSSSLPLGGLFLGPKTSGPTLGSYGKGGVASPDSRLAVALLLPGTENDDDAVTLDEDEDGGVGRHLDGVIAAVRASWAR